METEEYGRLLGTIAAIEVAVVGLARKLPVAERESIARSLDNLVRDAEQRGNSVGFAAGLTETATDLAKHIRMTA